MTQNNPLDLPLATPLPATLTPADALRRFAGLPHVVLFDSALRMGELGRYTFLAADPFWWHESPADGSPALDVLERQLLMHPAKSAATLPPFQGGAAGLFGYELSRSLERVPTPRYDEFGCPALAVGMYDVVLAWDHATGQSWLISQGFPELEPHARRERAEERLTQFQKWLIDGVNTQGWIETADDKLEILAPQWPATSDGKLTSSFSRADYLAAVERVVEYIRAGDVFQVNLS